MPSNKFNKNLLRVAIVTAVWKRPDIFEMFAEGVKVLQSVFLNVEFIVCVAGSEGRQCRDMVLKHGFKYVEHPNHPLSAKLNHATLLAKTFQPDYCLMMGSDDLIGVDLMDYYIVQMRKGIDYIYLLDCYFFDTVTKKGLYWAGYRKPHNIGVPAGIGRVISKRILNSLNWICWPLGYDKILDTGFDRALKRLSYSEHGILLREINCFALDIKSSTNMTPFDKWDNSSFVDGRDILFNNLPKHLAEMIYGKE
jgi:hypothetical protein